ncbi:probable LRR receptor-like serine/threonine-protein kinase At1g53440 isoform X1 [Camellia sinensis]|uniref:probable LRR receptor-like serine/threonine-protein kinase At1g53440 isoform X1 n=1 Tax=Camellia sinensis TaxID=4442 RepID=UPI001036DDDF|nr:probable LRR receptor-like serine/threonine-protein kinase At1g53440 isoform X1 [Camellia sinensis]XP_028065645.1 probable LRR receptor-like serine/threonine-protein kinase At1g53440 isoform X1 [Camellia sinensis]
MRRLFLSANNFTGTIPDTFSKLKNLTDFRIDGSVLSGKIPDLIGNWTKIKTLHMQGTSMDGPIPSTISQLKNITELQTIDVLAARLYFYYSLSYELTGDLAEIRRSCSVSRGYPSSKSYTT